MKMTFEEKFSIALQRIALKLSIHESEITRPLYEKHYDVKTEPSRRAVAKQGSFAYIRNALFPMPKNLVLNRTAQNVRRHKAQLDREYGDREIFANEFKKYFEDIMDKQPIPANRSINRSAPNNKLVQRTLVAMLSDTHLGANILKEEMVGTNQYNWKIAGRRLAQYAKGIADYKKDHRKETALAVAFNGDILAGLIHNQEHFVDLLSEQFAGGLHLLTQFFSFLADNNFVKMDIYCTTGNHGRVIGKKDSGRALTHKWDSYETMLYLSLKYYLEKHYKHVKVHVPYAPYIEYNLHGHNYFQSHGDTVVIVPSPGGKIDIAGVNNTVNKMNASRDDKYDCVLLSHIHTPFTMSLECGAELIVNGATCGRDPYAQSAGIWQSIPAQIMFEVTEKYAVGDLRKERLCGVDELEELDNIIKPFKEITK